MSRASNGESKRAQQGQTDSYSHGQNRNFPESNEAAPKISNHEENVWSTIDNDQNKTQHGVVLGSHNDMDDIPQITEDGEKTRAHIAEHTSSLTVGWDGPEDEANPQNWRLRKKIAVTAVVSCFTFISPVASSMIAPAFPHMNADLSVSSSVVTEMMLSAFVLAYAIGPLLYGPLSEVYGRVVILQAGNLVFLVFNLACGFANTGAQMVAFRFLSGLGGCAPLTAGTGLLSDCWKPEQRGRVWAIYSFMPLVGPAVGPIAAAFIAENTTWRWIYWSTSTFDVLVQILGFVFLTESYGPIILQRKVKRLRKEKGIVALRSVFENEESTRPKLKQIWTALKRPFVLLGTQPIIQVLAAYGGYLYGMIYLVLGTFPDVWRTQYHEETDTGGLNYVSLATGFVGGELILGFLNDFFYRRQRERAPDQIGRPEFRLPILVGPAVILPIGLLWYGWSAQRRAHWIVPNIGAAVYAAAVIGSFQIVITYLVDSYPRYTASAVGATTTVRYIASFSFPIFAPTLYRNLGWGWGNTVLALVGVGLGLPAAVILWIFGGKLRARSRFATEQI